MPSKHEVNRLSFFVNKWKIEILSAFWFVWVRRDILIKTIVKKLIYFKVTNFFENWKSKRDKNGSIKVLINNE